MLSSLKKVLIAAGRMLPSPVGASLFRYAYNCSPEEFERFAYQFSAGQTVPLKALAARGYSPKVIVDVGAYEGGWSRTVTEIWPRCHVIMVEPNREKQEMLERVAANLEATLFVELLGAEEGKCVEFHVMETGSSVFSERSAVPRRTESRRLRNLDELINGRWQVDFLKIDAQGYELQILAGAQRTLQNANAVLLEVPLIEVNRGSPTFYQVIAYLHRRGYVVYDIFETHRRPLDGVLSQVDLLFVRENSELRADSRFSGD